MVFAEPEYLALLILLVPAAGVVLARRERRRRADLQAFGEAPLLARGSALPARRRRTLRHGLFVLGLALVLVALARPQFGEKAAALSRTGRDVLFLLDLSRSMDARDVTPSRLEAAKQAAREVLRTSPGDRVGLIVFSGAAYLQLPLTLDRGAFGLFLDGARPGDISVPGTDIAAALTTAIATFERETAPSYRVAVLLSDGENFSPELGKMISRLRKARVRVFTVGAGTPEGAPIPEGGPGEAGPYHRDAQGREVVTRLRERTLRNLAQYTGGAYVRLGGAASARRVGAELAGLEKRKVSSRAFARLADRYQWPVGLALLALAAESLVSARERRERRP